MVPRVFFSTMEHGEVPASGHKRNTKPKAAAAPADPAAREEAKRARETYDPNDLHREYNNSSKRYRGKLPGIRPSRNDKTMNSTIALHNPVDISRLKQRQQASVISYGQESSSSYLRFILFFFVTVRSFLARSLTSMIDDR